MGELKSPLPPLMDLHGPVTLPPGRFTPTIRSQVEHAVAQIVPEGDTVAVLALADGDGSTVTVAAKVGDHWELAASAGKAWHGPISGQVVLVGSW